MAFRNTLNFWKFKATRTKADCVCVCVLHFAVSIYRVMKVRSIICLRYRHKETLWQLATEQIFSQLIIFNFLSPKIVGLKKKHSIEENKSSRFEIKCGIAKLVTVQEILSYVQDVKKSSWIKYLMGSLDWHFNGCTGRYVSCYSIDTQPIHRLKGVLSF